MNKLGPYLYCPARFKNILLLCKVSVTHHQKTSFNIPQGICDFRLCPAVETQAQ